MLEALLFHVVISRSLLFHVVISRRSSERIAYSNNGQFAIARHATMNYEHDNNNNNNNKFDTQFVVMGD